jgi:hypothetical protein
MLPGRFVLSDRLEKLNQLSQTQIVPVTYRAVTVGINPFWMLKAQIAVQ